jgi:hypothetical protein
VDLRDLMRHLQDGVDARLRVVAGVRRATSGLDDEDPGSLAARLEGPVRQRRFHHQDPAMADSQPLDDLARAAAPGFLV